MKCTALYSPQIHSNVVKLIIQLFTVQKDNNPKAYCKRVSQEKEMGYTSKAESVQFSYQIQNEYRETQTQAATKGCCSKDLAEYVKGRNTAFDDVHCM